MSERALVHLQAVRVRSATGELTMSKEPTRLVVSGSQQRAFQRQLETGRVALTPANLLAAVEGLEERKWRYLGGWLWVPEVKLDQIKSQHPHPSDRLREAFSYFLRLDPDASWRSVLRALDGMKETKLADRLRKLAEPVTDPTLTVEAVAAALQTVKEWWRIAEWLEVPYSIQHSIRASHSTDGERKKALAEYFINTLPAPSWRSLAGALSCCEDTAALQAVSSHLQREDEPSRPLHLATLCSVLTGVINWNGLGHRLGVPRSKRAAIEFPLDRHTTVAEGRNAMIKEWLESDHLIPSWRGLARALYRRGEVAEHDALQSVYERYLPAPTIPSLTLDQENRRMEYCDLVFGEPISEGASGVVCKGRWKQWNGGEVAIRKIIVADDWRNGDNKRKAKLAQVQDLCELSHSNLLSLYGTASRYPDDRLYIVTELPELGSLYQHFQEERGTPGMKLSLSWAIGVASGMNYLHEKKVLHRDLKSGNVWLTREKVAKLSVFHLLEEVAVTGPTAWTALEVINGAMCTKKSDVFSFATLLWELLSHQVPFEGCTADQIQSYIVEGKRPLLPDGLEFDMAKLIRDCWAGEPQKRPSFADILKALEEEEKLLLQDQDPQFEHEKRKIEFADFTIVEEIGEGGFGTVFRGTVKHFRGEVAIKQVKTSESSVKELDHLCGLKHPNIIKLYGTATKDMSLFIITELAELGSLHGHIKDNRGQPDMELSVHWATGVARGMSFLHEKDIVHRDLKSPNVLLTSRNRAKLCDFGVAKQMDHTTQATMAGTFPWMAPEVINEAAYSKRCDLFSYGTVLWELVTHKVPFEELKGVPFRIQMAIVDGKMPPIPESVAGYLSTLIQSCWDMDPKCRPTFVEVLSVLKSKGQRPGLPA